MCCHSRPLSVRLHAGGRRFTCPCCGRVRRYPPADSYMNFVEGRAFCDFCVRWMLIEGSPPTLSDAEGDEEYRLED